MDHKPIIVHITTVHQRYDVRIFEKQCKFLSKYNKNILLVVADGKGHETNSRVNIYDIGLLPYGRIGRMFIGSYRLLKLLLKQQPILVQFHDPELIFAGIFIKFCGASVVYDVHESIPEVIMKRDWLPKITRKPLSYLLSSVEMISAKMFDKVVAVTPAIALRFPSCKTLIVQNYPIAGEFAFSECENYLNRKHSFIYAGGITNERAALEMLEAIDQLSSDSAKLHLAGKFSPPDLESKLRVKSGWEKVIFHGWVNRSEMARLLSKARAGLVLFHPTPNHIESQPNKLFEYMAAGLPVIASDFPHWRKIVYEAKAGLLVDPRDPNAIAEAMHWIINNPKKSKKMGENGRRAVETVYNWNIEFNKLISMYNELLLNQSYE